MNDKDVKAPKQTTRRTVIAGAAAVAALPFAVSPAAAAGTVPQKTAQYQDHPKGTAQCSKCNYFIPGKDPKALGSCKQVAGAISPNGWCIFFAAKHA